LPVSAPEFINRDYADTLFLVDPYVPTGGVVFFHGKSSIGKSPLTWELARCVAAGSPFLGCPTRQGHVLYLDVDTPEHQIQKRVKLLPQPLPAEWYFEFASPFNVLQVPDSLAIKRLREAHEKVKPALVIVNTLRKVHYADDKESNIPMRVYGAFASIFPGAALWFTHHDKKDGDPTVPRNADEEFSGTQAWLNDATVGMHLRKNGPQKGLLRLDHTKSQVSDLRKPVTLLLDEDGTNVTVNSVDRDTKIRAAWDLLEDSKLTFREKEAQLATLFAVSPRTISRVISGSDDSRASR